MSTEIVFAVYRPHPGREAELERLVRSHVPMLRDLDLVTAREPVIVRARDGALVEVFEWASPESARLAHEVPAVVRVWEQMGAVAEFGTLAALPEAGEEFPHLRPL